MGNLVKGFAEVQQDAVSLTMFVYSWPVTNHEPFEVIVDQQIISSKTKLNTSNNVIVL